MARHIIPEAIWKSKISLRQKRLEPFTAAMQLQLVSLEDFLFAGNNLALEYFAQNQNPLRKLWEYNGLEPRCGSHSTYTYAAFLSLTQEQGREDLQQDVRWVGGIYASDAASGHHAWLEKRTEAGWAEFETIPDMRDIPAGYMPWYTFQTMGNKNKVTSEKLLGSFAAMVYGFTNS